MLGVFKGWEGILCIWYGQRENGVNSRKYGPDQFPGHDEYLALL